MIENGMHDVVFIAANTDAQALAKSLAPIKIQLGPKSTRGLGAGGQPIVGEEAAEESTRELAEHLRGADMVFLTAGMGAVLAPALFPSQPKLPKPAVPLLSQSSPNPSHLN